LRSGLGLFASITESWRSLLSILFPLGRFILACLFPALTQRGAVSLYNPILLLVLCLFSWHPAPLSQGKGSLRTGKTIEKPRSSLGIVALRPAVWLRGWALPPRSDSSRQRVFLKDALLLREWPCLRLQRLLLSQAALSGVPEHDLDVLPMRSKLRPCWISCRLRIRLRMRCLSLSSPTSPICCPIPRCCGLFRLV